jgi:fructosamine-3-kinase
MFITRAYNSFELDSITNILTKKSKAEKLQDEASFLTSLPQELSIFFPRLLSHGIEKETYFLRMENYAYRSLGTIMVNERFNKSLWLRIVASLKKINEKFSEFTQYVGDEGVYYSKRMYFDKTIKEYQNLIEGFERFKRISQHNQIIINGSIYNNFQCIWGKISKYIEKNILLKTFSVIHGDMCFSNILCGEDPKNKAVILKFIDPRGSFGKKWIYGDPLYDSAKLRHSFEGGYEYMIFDQFKYDFTLDLKSFNFKFVNDNKNKIEKIFGTTYDRNSKLIEGLIFIGMCARHYDSIDRQTIMYLTGVKLLNESIMELNL